MKIWKFLKKLNQLLTYCLNDCIIVKYLWVTSSVGRAADS